MANQTHVFYAAGLHCKSCVLLTESELSELPSVSAAKTDLAAGTITVTGDFGNKSAGEVARELTVVLTKHGYSLSTERIATEGKWRGFAYAAPIAVAFIVGFAALQKAGIANLVTSNEVSYGTAFAIGVVASLSTCMAAVGGLTLSLSASYAKHGDDARPQLLFHAGRILGFFGLGGMLGAAGSAFRLHDAAPAYLGIAAGLIMLVMGVNLLGTFDWAKRLQPSMPRFLSHGALGIARFNHTFAPFLIGAATFFLPCGFTQSMQFYALTTGGFLPGASVMLAFALGTLPVLALVSFGSFGLKDGAKKDVFFKTAGLITIAFALFNVMNGLVAAGLIPASL